MGPLSRVGLVAASITCPCVVSASRRPSPTWGGRIAPCWGARGRTTISRARTRRARANSSSLPPAVRPSSRRGTRP